MCLVFCSNCRKEIKFSEKVRFLTPCFEHMRRCIRNKEKVVFRKTFCTHWMEDSIRKFTEKVQIINFFSKECFHESPNLYALSTKMFDAHQVEIYIVNRNLAKKPIKWMQFESDSKTYFGPKMRDEFQVFWESVESIEALKSGIKYCLPENLFALAVLLSCAHSR